MEEVDKFEEELLNIKLSSISLGRAKADIQQYSEQSIEYHALESDIQRLEMETELSRQYLLSKYKKRATNRCTD